MMTTPHGEPSREDLLAEVAALHQERASLWAEVESLRQKVTELRQECDDLEIMLETTTDHFDHLSESLRQDRDDLETMLEMTTEHSDALEEELQSKAEALEVRNQFIRDTFGRYVSDEVVASLLDSPEGLQLGGEKRKATLLMSDLRGFTGLAERLDPQEVVAFLNHYLEAMVNIILS